MLMIMLKLLIYYYWFTNYIKYTATKYTNTY